MLSVAAATLCVWGALCLMFWLGSWQLLYHPKSAVAQTPANAGLAFDPVEFAPTDAGRPQLHGWWIAGGPERPLTAIYLHGANGNIGDAVDALIPLHEAGLNLLVFDYRGYGASAFSRPSERHWREDAEAAIRYLEDTRHIPPQSIALIGSGLGADLACEVGAAHPELAGVVLDSPMIAPEDAVFRDSRARLVPAHLLERDRWDWTDSATRLRIPSLWLVRTSAPKLISGGLDEAYQRAGSRKTRVWVSELDHSTIYRRALTRWLDDLVAFGSNR